MKKAIKLISTFLLAISILAMISCSNDSVENSTPAQQPEQNIDGEYTVKLEVLKTEGTYQEADLKTLKYLSNTIVLNKVLSKCIINEGESNKDYYCYEFEIPEKIKENFLGKDQKNVSTKGLLLSSKIILPQTEMKLTVSEKGKKIKTNCQTQEFIGSFGSITLKLPTNKLSTITLMDKNNKSKEYIPENDKSGYFGTWECKENSLKNLTITINKNGSGEYNFSEKEKGALKAEFDNIFGVTILDVATKNTLGQLLITGTDKLKYLPAGSIFGKDFTKQKTENKK